MYEETTGRTLLQKILLILLLATALLFTVLTAVFRSQLRVQWADSLLRPAQTGDTSVYTGASHGQDVAVRVYPTERTPWWTSPSAAFGTMWAG